MKYLVEPWAHQKVAIDRAKRVENLGLIFDVGTGKTMTMINIFRQKLIDHPGYKALIFAPPAILTQWKQEFAVHAPEVDQDTIVILSGTAETRTRRMKKHMHSARVVLTNYETVGMPHVNNMIRRFQAEILVCDESHKCKSYKSKRAQQVVYLADLAKNRYILTGTLVTNSAMDVYQQFRILDGGETFGHNFFKFRTRYFEDANSQRVRRPGYFPDFRPKKGSIEAINKLVMNSCVKAVKSECLDLPPLIKQIRAVLMSPEQKKQYESMKDDFVASIGEDDMLAQSAMTKVLRLQQILSGYIKTEEGKIIRFERNPRLKELKDMLEALTPNHKVIVWAAFKENYKMIEEVCKKLGVFYAQVYGGISPRQREQNIHSFRMDDDCRVLIAHPASAGAGLNLIESSYSIYYSKGYSMEHDVQSEARNYRGGSEIHDKITRIDLVCPGTIDEIINKALADKVDVAQAIIERKGML